MLNSIAELHAFHRFAEQRLQLDAEVSLEECLEQWRADQERSVVQAAILEGLADAEAGRLHSLEEVDREIQERFGIVSDA